MNVTNVLLNAGSMQVVDYNRPKLPYELEINNVDLDNIPVKQTTITVPQGKKDSKGNPLYLLPQPDLETTEQVHVKIVTTESTSEPIMITEVVKVPLLDNEGKQITNSLGMPCFITKEEQVQQTDDKGNKLFYLESMEPQVVYTPQNPIEITNSDAKYVDGLELSMEDVQQPVSYQFKGDFPKFTYADIVNAKEQQLLVGTLYSNATLFEQFGSDVVDVANSHADYVVDKLSLPVNGVVKFKELTLPTPVTTVKLLLETSANGLTLKLNGATATNNEFWLDSTTNKVDIEIDNPTGKRVDILSLAILH